MADYLESVETSAAAVRRAPGELPRLKRLVGGTASFKNEIGAVRHAIAPSGDVVDHASPALGSIRDRLRRQRAKLRQTLDAYLRGKDTAKYLQDQIVTERNGRFVLLVKAEHRASLPGLVHGSSASGQTLYLEPLATVEINNEVVELEVEEAEEVQRILLALTDAFRAAARRCRQDRAGGDRARRPAGQGATGAGHRSGRRRSCRRTGGSSCWRRVIPC